jgi:hypothetical protein
MLPTISEMTVVGLIVDGVTGIFHSFRPHYGPGIDLAFNRKEYQEYLVGGKGGRCVWLTNLSLPCTDCQEILRASAS